MPSLLFRCAACSEANNKSTDYEADSPQCPKCGAVVGLQPLVRCHLVVEDPAGPVVGRYAKRYRCVCDPKLVMTRELEHSFAMSGEVRPVNCSKCMQTAEYRKLKDIDVQREAERQGFYTPPTVEG